MFDKSEASIPIKSGIGVRFDIIFIGKKESMFDEKNNRTKGSIIMKYSKNITIESAVFLKINPKSIARDM